MSNSTSNLDDPLKLVYPPSVDELKLWNADNTINIGQLEVLARAIAPEYREWFISDIFEMVSALTLKGVERKQIGEMVLREIEPDAVPQTEAERPAGVQVIREGESYVLYAEGTGLTWPGHHRLPDVRVSDSVVVTGRRFRVPGQPTIVVITAPGRRKEDIMSTRPRRPYAHPEDDKTGFDLGGLAAMHSTPHLDLDEGMRRGMMFVRIQEIKLRLYALHSAGASDSEEASSLWGEYRQIARALGGAYAGELPAAADS